MWLHRSRDHSIPHGPFPICFFRHFFGKTHRLATTHTVRIQTTDRRQTNATLRLKRYRGLNMRQKLGVGSSYRHVSGRMRKWRRVVRRATTVWVVDRFTAWSDTSVISEMTYDDAKGDSVLVPSESSRRRSAMMSRPRPTAERNWIVARWGLAAFQRHAVTTRAFDSTPWRGVV